MRLQTDPAVIYGLGDAFDGNLTRAHLEADTSVQHLQARSACHRRRSHCPDSRRSRPRCIPDDGDFLYFVARGDGSSEFSATLDEHLAAVRRYQLEREEIGDAR